MYAWYEQRSYDAILKPNVFSLAMNHLITEWHLIIYGPSPQGQGHKLWAYTELYSDSYHQTNVYLFLLFFAFSIKTDSINARIITRHQHHFASLSAGPAIRGAWNVDVARLFPW